MTFATQEADVAIDRCLGNPNRLRQGRGRTATGFDKSQQQCMPFCDSETSIVRHVFFPEVYQEMIDMPRREGKNNAGTSYAVIGSSLRHSVAVCSPIAF